VNCDCSQTTGKLCREYRFEKEVCIGYIDYSYNSDLQLTGKKFFSKEGKLKKSIFYEYANTLLIKESESYTDNQLLNNYSQYIYTVFDSIAEKKEFCSGQEVNRIVYEYDSINLRKKESTFDHDTLINYTEYFYDNENKLWKTIARNFDGGINQIRMYDYYDNLTLRITLYDSMTNFAGFELYRYNTENLLLEVDYHDKDNALETYDTYDYKENQLLKKSSYDNLNNRIAYTVYKYH
jgi:hypothetical protein